MPRATSVRRDPATVLFHLPDFHVIDARRSATGRDVVIGTGITQMCCPVCHVPSTRVHVRKLQRVRDIPAGGGPVTAWWYKLRFRCGNTGCAKATFTEHTPQVRPYAGSTSRLANTVVDADVLSGRSIAETARAHRIGWWTVQRALTARAAVLPDPGLSPATVKGPGGPDFCHWDGTTVSPVMGPPGVC
ncbi:transposase [Nakamurella antarctica]|uniref:Transposase n=1 Tax=Nakamurella antarctica TaxID=1902245 RepID=A0A3G8ZJN9_9ACTN|nr:helix-turn-helix domain-containing protein [Nakamurella antarctica]AZI57420.1 transposase [Nakamurella antarctica]